MQLGTCLFLHIPPSPVFKMCNFGHVPNYTPSTDKNGTLFEYTYNGAPWLLSKTATGTNGTTQSVSYEYDYLGNITQMVDETGTTLYTYDMLGNTLTETRGSLIKEYTYDANGNRTSANIADGPFSHNLTYTYDKNNRLTKVTDDTGYAKYSYDKNNRILTETMYNSSYSAARKYTAYTYYDSGMLDTKKNYRYSSASSSYLIDDYILTYHADGNIATVDNNDAVTSYIYDNAGRLTSESIDGTVKASYTYDARGNRATMTEPDRVTTYSYNKNNRIGNAITEGDGIYIYHYYDYDKNGNLKEDHNYDYMRNYTYNLFGNMVSSRTVDGAIIDIDTYTYDGNGIRTSKTVDGITTNFINDGGYVVGEVSGDSIIKYTYGTGLISINNNGTVGYYHTDEHGNVSAISDTSRKVVADYDFDAFGNQTVSTDTYYNPMRYCGEYHDKETGNIYLRARYYNPAIGRFLSVDPIKDGTNWYVYCSNNPIAFVDPSGLMDVAVARDIWGWTRQTVSQITMIDGPAPYADAVAGVIIIGGGIVAGITAGVMWISNALIENAPKSADEDTIKENNSNNGSNSNNPDDKPNLKTVNNKTANSIAEKNGFKDAHEFKESFVGKTNISKFNMKVDKNTGEIFLESVKKGGKTIATGYYQ